MPTTTTNTEDLIAPGEELIPLKIEPDYIYVTIPTEYICVYQNLLILLANYGKQMLIECKASCTERNTKVIECYNMFNAAIAARKLGKDNLANTLIKYIKSQINLIYKDKDDSTSFVFPIDNKGEIQAFVKCGDIPEVYINAKDKDAYEAYMGLISDYEPPEEETAYDVVKNIRELLNENILRPNLQGITFADGYATDNVADILMYDKSYMITITSEAAKPIIGYAFANCASLTEVNFPNAISIESHAFAWCSSLHTVEFPNATSIGEYAFYYCTTLSKAIFPNVTVVNSIAFSGCILLTYLDISSVMSFTLNAGGPLQGCLNLIDIHMGKNITTNVNLSTALWKPSNAYLNTTNNLVPADVRVEHPEWTNRDYLLYCLREHFAANLPDRNGLSSLTISFNSTMKTYINDSPETAAAFTSKNYIIA